MTWLDDLTSRIAAAHGLDAASIGLVDGDAETLLDLAGIAAHTTGERTNAPLLCHVLGRARALGVPLEDLARTVRGAVGGT
ncbi:MAG: hypothetical protein ACKOZL_05695 [Actinomycetes bacterium]